HAQGKCRPCAGCPTLIRARRRPCSAACATPWCACAVSASDACARSWGYGALECHEAAHYEVAATADNQRATSYRHEDREGQTIEPYGAILRLVNGNNDQPHSEP